MPDTVSIIHLKGESLSVEAEKKRHSDWVKQEAQFLMDELFLDLQSPMGSACDHDLVDNDPMDVDWVEGYRAEASLPKTEAVLGLSHPWQSLELDEPIHAEDDVHWISPAKTTPFYHRWFLILGGLAIVTPLSLWGGTVLKTASQPKSGIAAMPLESVGEGAVSDSDFARYAEKALQQIEKKPHSVAQPVGITTLPTLKIGEVPGAIPPVTSASGALPVNPSATNADPSGQNVVGESMPVASPPEINRLALRVFPPTPVKSAVPPAVANPEPSAPSGAVAAGVSTPSLPQPNSSNITPAPASTLPSLSPTMSEPVGEIAAVTPMQSPKNANKKVIGIVELGGGQSTLMVSNNGSHLNFQVGDTVDADGWRLVQIAQGKAILQKGTEYKSLSEGQYF